MKILVSGITPNTNNGYDPVVHYYVNIITPVVSMLKKNGHDVTWGPCPYGSDLSSYDVVIFGYMDMKSRAVKHLIQAMYASKNHPNFWWLVDDGKQSFTQIQAMCRTIFRHESDYQRFDNMTYKKQAVADIGWTGVQSFFQQVHDTGVWGRGFIVPKFVNGDIKRIGYLPHNTIFYEHSGIAFEYAKELGINFENSSPYSEKKNGWIHPALVANEWVEKNLAKSDWTIYHVGSTKPPVDMRENSLYIERMTEPELIETFIKKYKGLVAAPYRFAGNGISWRLRYLLAAEFNSVVYAHKNDLAMFGESWVEMSTKTEKELENLPDSFFARLKKDYWDVSWSYEQGSEFFEKVLNS